MDFDVIVSSKTVVTELPLMAALLYYRNIFSTTRSKHEVFYTTHKKTSIFTTYFSIRPLFIHR